MTKEDISNLLYLHRMLIQEWFQLKRDAQAYYTSIDQLPYRIQDSIKLLDSYGYRFNIETQRFID
jgi:hypothetical protein